MGWGEKGIVLFRGTASFYSLRAGHLPEQLPTAPRVDSTRSCRVTAQCTWWEKGARDPLISV